MALELLSIITAAGTGAVTGYLTNNLALKMIFKEYGPLGGVVIKTKNEFIDSISELVERDLINHHTLEKEFSRPEFKHVFRQSVSDFLNLHLEQHSSGVKLAEIPGWEQNYQLFSSFLAEGSVELLESFSREVEEKELNTIVSEAEVEKLLKRLYSKLLHEAEARGSLESLTLNFYDQLKDKNINELLTENIQVQIKDFIKEVILYFQTNYKNLEIEEKKFFKEKVKALFSLENLSHNITKEIKELRLSDLFKDKNELNHFKESGELFDILKKIVVNLKIEIDNSDLKVEDLFNEEQEEKLKSDIEKVIYSAEAEILKFLEAEEDELNTLILKAVEAEIEESSGLKAMSRQGIYSKYQENIDEYGLPLEHLKDYLNSKLSSENKDLSDLAFKKLGDLELNKLLHNLQLEDAVSTLEESVWNYYQQNYKKKIIELFSEELFLQEEVEEKIIDLIFASIKNLSGEEESVELLLDYGLNFTLGDLITEEELKDKTGKIAPQIYQLLIENDSIAVKAAENLNRNFFSLLNNELNESQSELLAGAEKYFNKFEAEFAEKELKNLYSAVKGEKETVASFTESISTFFYNNLPELIEGKVAQAASANLHQLSDQEVQKAIEDFMGKELKPITYLGALLGAAAGIIFSLSGAETAIFTASPLWVDYLSSALLYGGVGWLTNVLAIWMIFHPYEELNLAGARIPFTPGVVAKNRSRFADSMGKFVEKELLKANSAAEIIEKNRQEIKDRGLEYFKESDYQQFFELLREKNNFLSAFGIEKIREFLSALDRESLETLINPLNQKLNKIAVQNLDKLDFAEEILDYLNKDGNSLEKLDNLIISNLSVEKITSAAAGEYQLKLNSKEIKRFLQNKELYPVFKLLLPYLFEREIDFDLKARIIELLSLNSGNYLDKALAFLYQKEEKVARLINFKKDEIIEQEKEKKGGLLKNTLISGAIYMADLDEFVDSVVERVFSELRVKYFPEKKDKLEKSYANFLLELENEELLNSEALKVNQILKTFLSSAEGGKLLTEILYLSDEEINNFIKKLLKEDEQILFSFNLEIRKEEIEYFINKELNLEQKLKLLMTVKKLFSAENIENEISKILKENNLEALNEELKDLLAEIDLIEADLISPELFEEAKANLVSLMEQPKLKELIGAQTAEKFIELAEILEEKMERESLNFLLDLAIEGGVDSFKANSEELLKSLELKELTADEVRKMNPAEIEEIFDSFAGRYFSHLKQYGWFGGVFGILQLLLRTLI